MRRMRETWFLQGEYHKPKGAGADLRIEPEVFRWRLSGMQFVPWVGLKLHLGEIGIVEVAKFHYRTESRLGPAGFVVECVPVTEGDQALVAELEEKNAVSSEKREEMVNAVTAMERGSLTVSIPQVAEILGISKASAYAAAHRGELPGVIRFGKRIMVGRAALEKALREGWVPPQREER
jgi:hypothetical protein